MCSVCVTQKENVASHNESVVNLLRCYEYILTTFKCVRDFGVPVQITRDIRKQNIFQKFRDFLFQATYNNVRNVLRTSYSLYFSPDYVSHIIIDVMKPVMHTNGAWGM